MRKARGEAGDADEVPAVEDEDVEAGEEPGALSIERIATLEAAEEIILTVSTEGFGKRTSAYEFRRTGRGGQGLLAQDLTKKGGKLAASFPGGRVRRDPAGHRPRPRLIRTPVSQVRMVGRNTSGVTIFRTAADEHVVSVERLADTGEDDADVGLEEGEGPDEAADGGSGED